MELFPFLQNAEDVKQIIVYIHFLSKVLLLTWSEIQAGAELGQAQLKLELDFNCLIWFI